MLSNDAVFDLDKARFIFNFDIENSYSLITFDTHIDIISIVIICVFKTRAC